MLTALTLLVGAQMARPSVTFDALKAKPGASVKATARVTIPDGWHAYQNPPKSQYQNPLKLSLGKTAAKASAFSYPKGKPEVFAGEETLVYEGRQTVTFRVTVPKTAKSGALKVPVVVAYQLCNDKTCLPPSTMDATLIVTVVK